MSNQPDAKEIFSDALELPPNDREEFVRRRCVGNTGLLAEVLELLKGLEGATGFLSTPLAGSPTPPGVGAEGPGTVIGRYRLLEKVGEGGFGVVFLAEQREPVVRHVALKIIKAGMDSAQVIARFEAERQALALMDHPNIAKVLDAGSTDQGRPYFVMELVKGVPITAYCDGHQLTVSQRLELFSQVCAAVQHAHTKGVVHRDIKPTNVLVSEEDGRAHARVIDFGIAKATDQRRVERASFTESGQFLGTPEYMSPEQAAGEADIDTRTDVYSLGVLLYELLTGSTPLEADRLRSAAYGEVVRIIQEEDPPAPSTRLSRASARGTAAGVAERRGTEARRLTTVIRGDLDWIVMKALEKDRTRRYETASALAADVHRYLAGEPVTAAPPSRAYQAKKFVRRHKAGVVAGALVGLALVAGLGAALWGMAEARRERDAARAAERAQEKERVAAERVTEFMQNLFASVDPEVAQSRDASLLKDVLDRAAERIERGELADSPASELELRIRLAGVYRTVAEFQKAERMLAPASDLLTRARPGDQDVWDRLTEARATVSDGLTRHEETVRLNTELAESRRRRFGEKDGRVAAALWGAATGLYYQGKLKESEEKNLEALAVAEAAKETALLANIHNSLLATLQALGRLDEAAEHGDKAIEFYKSAFPGDHPQTAITMTSMVSVKARQPGKLDEAEAMQREAIAMFRRLFPGGHPNLGTGINNLGWILKSRGKMDEAEPLFEEALIALEKYGDSQGALLAQVQINLGQVARARGDWPKAERMAREALATCQRTFPDGHYITSFALSDLGSALREQGRLEESVKAYRAAADLQRRVLGPKHPFLVTTFNGMGDSLMRLGRAGGPGGAAETYREALGVVLAGPDDPAGRAAAQSQLAVALAASGSPEDAKEAVTAARESLATRTAILKAGDWRLANTRSILGGALAASVTPDDGKDRTARMATLAEARSLAIPAAEELRATESGVPKAVRGTIVRAALGRAAAICDALHAAGPSDAAAAERDAWKARLQEWERENP